MLYMGKLKPGATYIYEKADGVTYAREMGCSERFEIGRDYPNVKDDIRMWEDIHSTAKTNPALQQAIDRVIMLYKLSKDKV